MAPNCIRPLGILPRFHARLSAVSKRPQNVLGIHTRYRSTHNQVTRCCNVLPNVLCWLCHSKLGIVKMSPLVTTLFSALGIGPATTVTNILGAADRRQAERFKTELALQWPGGTAVVRDISSNGVRFETDHPISPDENMKFTIVIPDDEGRYSLYTLCDSEIHWTARSPTAPHRLSVGASFTKFKSFGLPSAA